jgi:hypothetical protein
MFKCVLWILFDGGDGAPFPINSPMGYYTCGTDRPATGLAVYPIYGTHVVIFFPVFCYFARP